LFDLHLVAALMHAGWLVQEGMGRGEAPAVGGPRQRLVISLTLRTQSTHLISFEYICNFRPC